MKPFNLKEAKSGKPVCTRGGYDVRVLCFDMKGKYPVVGIIARDDGEVLLTFDNCGRLDTLNTGEYDLMMKTETKTGYINRYRVPQPGRDARIFKSPEAARQNIWDEEEYLGMATVTWEE